MLKVINNRTMEIRKVFELNSIKEITRRYTGSTYSICIIFHDLSEYILQYQDTIEF